MIARAVNRGVRAATWTTMAVLLAVGLLTAIALVAPGTARAGMASGLNPIDNFCKNNQSLYLPSGADNGTSNESNRISRFTASGDAAEGTGFTVATGVGGARWRDPGDGLIFETFGLSMCDDASAKATAHLGDAAWQMVAVWPARLVGMILDWALSGALSSMLLGLIAAPLDALYRHTFLSWAPLLIGLGLITIMFNVARRRGRGMSDFAWMVGVVVVTAALASPAGIQLARTATEAVGSAATCAATDPMGGCKDGEGSVSTTVIDGLLAQTWGASVLGDLADEPIPSTITLNEQLKDSTPDIRDGYAVTIPVDAIPAGPDGVVSYAEALRWTNAYTVAESTRMASKDGASARCTFRDRLPSIGDVTGKTHGDLSMDALCSYKGMVRAAIYSDLATSHPGAYASATGKSSPAIAAVAGAAFGLTILMVAVGLIAIVGLLSELELVFLVLSAPIVGLGALRSPTVGRRWGTEVVASMVRRFAVGVTVGIVLWAVAALTTAMTAALSGKGTTTGLAGAGIATVAPKFVPVAVTIAAVIAGVAAFMLLRKLQAIMLAGVGVQGTTVDDQVAQRGRQLGAMAVGAAAGTIAAPADVIGGMVAGGRRGARAGGSPVKAAVGGWSAGVRKNKAALAAATHGDDKPTRDATDRNRPDGDAPIAPPRTPPRPVPPPLPPTHDDQPTVTAARPGPRAGDDQDADRGWDALRTVAPARAYRDAEKAAAEADLDRLQRALNDARDAYDEYQRHGSRRIQELTAWFVRERGMDNAQAEREAMAKFAQEVDDHTKRVNGARLAVRRAEDAITAAKDTPTQWDRAADAWARSGAPLTQAAAALGLATEAELQAYTSYVRMVRPDTVTPDDRPGPTANPGPTDVPGPAGGTGTGDHGWWGDASGMAA